MANEGFARSLHFLEGWLTKTDSITGLIPTNLTRSSDIWEPHNSAADNYAFMVLSAYILNKNIYNGQMLNMLKTEKKLTSRVKTLPDNYSFSKQDYQSDDLNMASVIFGTSEYIKDGLIPLSEYIGKSPWQDRMMEMLDDLHEYMKNPEELKVLFADREASIEEVNGEMLQTLSRIYWMTGNKKYLDWALKIADFYLMNGRDLTQIDYLRIRDHGCEIIGGLSELYVTLHFADKEKKEAYQQPFYKILDRVLEVGRNEDGLFYNAINPRTGTVADSGVVDNWGYIFDAYYAVWMVDKKQEYREAVLNGFKNLDTKYRNFEWEGKSHDGYADALESGINLYNREPHPGMKSWIESQMPVMFAMQQDDGIISGWHGDGNFARTAIMYSLWKTLGATVSPWRKDVIIGAEKTNGNNYFVIKTEKDWEGKLIFDTERHKTILHLPIDYTRINQLPEWFTVKNGDFYSVHSSSQNFNGTYSSEQLEKGIPVSLKAGETIIFRIEE